MDIELGPTITPKPNQNEFEYMKDAQVAMANFGNLNQIPDDVFFYDGTDFNAYLSFLNR